MERNNPLAWLVLAASVIAGVSYVASWYMALPDGVGTAW